MKTFLTALATATVLPPPACGFIVTRPGTRRPPPPTPVSVPVVQLPAPAKAAPENNGELEGRLEPGSEVEIRTSLIDYPVRLKANAGDFVQKGQLLVELGDSKLEESVKQAEAALNVVKTDSRPEKPGWPKSDKEQPVCSLPAAKRRPRHAGADTENQTGSEPRGSTRPVSAPTSRSRRRPGQARPGRDADRRSDLGLCDPAASRRRAEQAGRRFDADRRHHEREDDGSAQPRDVFQSRRRPGSPCRSQRDAGPHFSSAKLSARRPSAICGRSDTSISIEVANPEALLKPGHVRPRAVDVRPEQRAADWRRSLLVRQGSGGRGPDGKTAGPQTRRGAAFQPERPDADDEHDGQRPRAAASRRPRPRPRPRENISSRWKS